MFRRSMAAAVAIVVLGGMWPETAAAGTTYFVRTWGDDTLCDGTTPDPPSGSSTGQHCAVRTPTEAVSKASCGDIVDIGEGEYWSPRLNMDSTACTATTWLTIKGASKQRTWWFVSAEPLTDCALLSGHTATYECTWPSVAVWDNSDIYDRTVIQRNADGVEWSDENGCKGTIFGPLNLTPRSDAEGIDGEKGVEAIEGTVWVDTDTGKVYVHPWKNRSPDEARLFAPRLQASGGAWALTRSSYVKIRDITLVGPHEAAIYTGTTESNGSNNIVFQDVRIYGGEARLKFCDYMTLENFETANQQLRIVDATATHSVCERWRWDEKKQKWVCSAQSWDKNSQALTTGGSDHVTMTNVLSHNAREGTGFSGGAHDYDVDGLTVHSCWNHGLKFIESSHDIRMKNVLAYNNQEGLFIACAYDLTFEHAFFADPVIVQGNPSGCPAGEPRDVDIYNSVLRRVEWLNYGDGTRKNGGYDLDYNLYVYENWGNDGHYSDDTGAGASTGLWGISDLGDIDGDNTPDQVYYYTLDEVHAAEDDSCAGCDGTSCDPCTNDPHSAWTRDWETVFVHYLHDDAIYRHKADFHLAPTSAAYDKGDASRVPSLDLDRNPRDGRADAGPYDRNSSINNDAPTPRRLIDVILSGVTVE